MPVSVPSSEPFSAKRPVRVFVFLGEGFGTANWRSRLKTERLPGICDDLPYGNFHAGNECWQITYSEDRCERGFLRLLRLASRKVLGFDLLHAYFNRRQLSESDVVWTHTEREYLAALCLWCLWPPRARPKLIAQTVWLLDRWSQFSPVRRWLYSALIRSADIMTFLSPANMKEAKRLFPEKRCELVLFGLDSAQIEPARRTSAHNPIRILSLGSDMHRDWDTLIEAARQCRHAEVRIASRAITMKRSWPANLTIVRPQTGHDVKALYDWADLVVIALKPNLHASGITVIAEAVLRGRAVICTDTGGLRAYFGDREITYVAPREPREICQKIAQLAGNDDLRFERSLRAQRKILRDKLTSRAYAIRHRSLSESLLQPAPCALDDGEKAARSEAERLARRASF